VSVVVARVYDAGAAGGGHRVLVDRLWPRGVARAALAHDEWAKDLAPSDALRRWYGHDPARFAEFARRYRAELEAPAARQALAALARRAGRGRVTLLTATRDVEHSGAAVLRAVIEERRRRAGRSSS